MVNKAVKFIEEHKTCYIDVSDKIWQYAEVGLQEHKSSKLLAEVLTKHGFKVESAVAGMPTAFTATWGNGKPKIGFLAEYDALPHLSQKAQTTKQPLINDAPGHGCGHNLYGAAVLGAVLGLQAEMKADNLKGTIVFYGCPAEETLVGKVFMAREGLFNDLDLAITWHPSQMNTTWAGSCNAMNSVKFNFHGKTAHAAGDPHNGRSALDAVELMNVGVNYLREHVIPDARIHYVITNGGGEPNVVPDKAQVWYYVRAPRRDYVDEIFERVVDVAKGAAIMTGTTMDYNILAAAYNYLPNDTIGDVMLESLKEIGAPKWSETEINFAKELTQTFEPMKVKSLRVNNLYEKYKSTYLHDEVIDPLDKGKCGAGSTDVSDVSWITATGQITTACLALGTPGHSWQVVSCSGMSIGHKGLIYAAKAMALTASKLLHDQELVKKAQAEFKAKTKDNPYKCPLPANAVPPLDLLPKH
ncbi:amidohydrolase [Clostridium sp. 'deep sea']|uniref:M20 family metallopeptidase n=1 Tax=Clostridium sp. 'deep sea' TaxID=2779445 RepID=UPI00189657D6|nr:M20 family metallopeptidase [Clostridium sp. 'deep sea']QOR36614.1 amidohydrolase [Clostridium sp. 'deep sea']